MSKKKEYWDEVVCIANIVASHECDHIIKSVEQVIGEMLYDARQRSMDDINIIKRLDCIAASAIMMAVDIRKNIKDIVSGETSTGLL